MNRVVHFEIHAENPERAAEFYSELFGWEFQKWDGPMPYWVIRTGADDQPGINGGLLPRRGTIDGEAVIAYVCTVDVEDVDVMAEKAISGGGTVVVPKMTIPGVGHVVYCKDTDGNIFGMIQNIAATA